MELHNMRHIVQQITDGADSDLVIEPFSFRKGFLNEILFCPRLFLSQGISARIVVRHWLSTALWTATTASSTNCRKRPPV